MRTCIDIFGEIASLFSRYDFTIQCSDNKSVDPDGCSSRFSCMENADIFWTREDIDTQDMECDVHFHKCRTCDKVKNRNVCSDNATWYIINDDAGYWEDIRYPVYCRRGKSRNYSKRCESDYLENPWCFHPFSRNKGNNCQS